MFYSPPAFTANADVFSVSSCANDLALRGSDHRPSSPARSLTDASMWGAAGGNRTNIEEANKHLQALTERVAELELASGEQALALQQKDEQMRAVVHDVTQRYEEELGGVRARLAKEQQLSAKLSDQAEERERELHALRQKMRMVDELVKYKPALAKLTISLEQIEQFSKYQLQKTPYGGGGANPEPGNAGLSLAEKMLNSVSQRPAQNGEFPGVEKELFA